MKETRGQQVQNSEYLKKYNTAMQIFAEGNTLRVVSEPEIKKPKRTEVVKPEPEKKQPRTAVKAKPARRANSAARPAQQTKTMSRKARAARKSRLKRYVAAGIAAALVIGMCMLYLSMVVENNNLIRNISILETQLDDIKAMNDAKEFEINSSVDLNHVIDVATGELGMIRGTTEQIRTYDTSKSEYIQHLAGVPSE